MLTKLRILNILLVVLPLHLVADFFFLGVKRHFVTLRALIPTAYQQFFKDYATTFVARFGISALTSFQTFTKVLTVIFNSMLASLFFISLKFYNVLLVCVKYPFSIFLFYYSDLYIPFVKFVEPLVNKEWFSYILPAYNSISFILLTLLTFMLLRFVWTLFSIINQVRLIFYLCVDHIQQNIIYLLNTLKVSEPIILAKKEEAQSETKTKVTDKLDLSKLSADELVELSTKALAQKKVLSDLENKNKDDSSNKKSKK